MTVLCQRGDRVVLPIAVARLARRGLGQAGDVIWWYATGALGRIGALHHDELADARPQAPRPPVDYSTRILAAVERTRLRSARAIFDETGGNKVTVLETVKRMIRDGRSVTNPEGVYQVGGRA
jgi:hypothetical protein